MGVSRRNEGGQFLRMSRYFGLFPYWSKWLISGFGRSIVMFERKGWGGVGGGGRANNIPSIMRGVGGDYVTVN